MEALSDEALAEQLKHPDPKVHLVAVRDYLINELTGHRCKACQMSQLRTGDTAALVLRLTTVLKDIDGLGGGEKEDPVADIMNRRDNVTPIRRNA